MLANLHKDLVHVKNIVLTKATNFVFEKLKYQTNSSY
jgi:hypothetical protein